MPSSPSSSHDAVVLFVDPGRQLTDALPAREGQAWRPLVADSIESGLELSRLIDRAVAEDRKRGS